MSNGPVSPLVTGRTVIDRNGDIYQYTPPTLTPSAPPPVPPLVVRRIATDNAGTVFEYTPPTLTRRTPLPPTNSTPPQIVIVTGGGAVGSQIVRQNPGTWVPPGPYANQWQSAGVNIPGATAVSYNAQASDVGNMITLVVTVTTEGGSLSATSNAIGPITE